MLIVMGMLLTCDLIFGGLRAHNVFSVGFMVASCLICELLGPIHAVSMFLLHCDDIYELGFTVLHGLGLGSQCCWFILSIYEFLVRIHDISMFLFHCDDTYDLGFTVRHGLRLGSGCC